jgi:K+-transporting ATPase KdpF subunit
MSRPAGDWSEVTPMNIDAIVGLVISVLLLAYLVYAMLRPEKF